MIQIQSPSTDAAPASPLVLLSIGIMARNEADSIHLTLDSLFAQDVFREFAERGDHLEIICVVNGSSDATDTNVTDYFVHAALTHPHRACFAAHVHVLAESGKPNATNEFIHTFSAKEARTLVLMDADITFVHPSAIWNLFQGLEQDHEANVTVGQPRKSLSRHRKSTARERLSLATSTMTQSVPGQLTGQLYGIRTATARRIRFPRALTSCDDGLVKNLVCTQFGTTALQPGRILAVPDAAHEFDAYLPLKQILMNQKRQMMGQAFLHLLVVQFLPSLPVAERFEFARVVRDLEDNRPTWLTELMSQHLLRTGYFWRLFPGFLTFRFTRLRSFPFPTQVKLLPAATAGFVVTLWSGWLAARALRQGNSQYWPELRNAKRSFTPQMHQSR